MQPTIQSIILNETQKKPLDTTIQVTLGAGDTSMCWKGCIPGLQQENAEALHSEPSQTAPQVSLVGWSRFLYLSCNQKSRAFLRSQSHSSELLNLSVGSWESSGFVASWSEVRMTWRPLHLWLVSQVRAAFWELYPQSVKSARNLGGQHWNCITDVTDTRKTKCKSAQQTHKNLSPLTTANECAQVCFKLS